MSQHIILIMTACIQVPQENLGIHDIYRSDTLVRFNDYKTSLKSWLGHQDDRITGIVFIENSGYDLSELKEMAASENRFHRNIEFLQLIGGPIPPGVHYGYAPLEMIDYAFENSALIAKSDYIMNVTGRLYFPTASRLIDKLKNHLFIADSRDYGFFHIQRHYILVTIFIAKTDFYRKYLYNTRHTMAHKKNDHMETLYFSILKPLYDKNPKQFILRFPFNVEPVGIGAHLNVSYQSRKKRIASSLRNVCRRVLPFLWI
jgi:hypothetical protein